MKLNKRAMVLLISLALLLVVSAGATLAYLLTKTDPLQNDFASSKVACQVNENEGSYSLQNIGDTDAYIRAKIVVTWKNEAGHVYAQTPTELDYTLDQDALQNWFQAEDGFWYYAKATKPLDSTDVLIQAIQLSDSASVPEGYHLSVEIVASAVQATAKAVTDWSNAVTVVSDGADLTKKP